MLAAVYFIFSRGPRPLGLLLTPFVVAPSSSGFSKASQTPEATNQIVYVWACVYFFVSVCLSPACVSISWGLRLRSLVHECVWVCRATVKPLLHPSAEGIFTTGERVLLQIILFFCHIYLPGKHCLLLSVPPPEERGEHLESDPSL